MNNITYLFCSGGYDSTYLLCYNVLVLKKNIVPIYIASKHIDGILMDEKNNIFYNNNKLLNKGVINDNIRFGGRNTKIHEINRLILICNKINEMKVKLSINTNKLYPLQIIYNNKLDNDILHHIKNLSKYFSRLINQYTYIAQILKNSKIHNADIGSEYNNKDTVLSKLVIDYKNNILSVSEKKSFLYLFNKLQFYLINNKINKYNMYNISLKYDFYKILQLTISCWYIDKFGNCCNKCKPCKERIIKYKKIILL